MVRQHLEFACCFLRLAATSIDGAKQVVGSGRLQNRFQAVARESQSGNLHAELLRERQCLAAMSFLRRSEHVLQLHLDPNLVDVGPTSLARKKAMVEQTRGALKFPASVRFKINSKMSQGGASSSLGYFSRASTRSRAGRFNADLVSQKSKSKQRIADNEVWEIKRKLPINAGFQFL